MREFSLVNFNKHLFYLLIKTNLNHFHNDILKNNIDNTNINTVNFVGVCVNTIKLNNKEVPLTEQPNGQIDGETLFKFDIFS